MKYLYIITFLYFQCQLLAQDSQSVYWIATPNYTFGIDSSEWIEGYVKEDIHKPYTYSGTVTDIYDGDTFTLEFNLGFGLVYEDVIRLARVDTPEIRGSERPEGIKVRDAVEQLILNQSVIAVTKQDDRGKYGRLIAEIYFKENGLWVNLSDYLLKKAMAILYQ